jgi:hypothetical protein
MWSGLLPQEHDNRACGAEQGLRGVRMLICAYTDSDLHLLALHLSCRKVLRFIRKKNTGTKINT